MSMKKCLAICVVFFLVASLFGVVAGATRREEHIEKYTLTVEEPIGEGFIHIDDDKVNLVYTENYEKGTLIQLEAHPAEDYEFVKWQIDEEVYEEQNLNLTIEEDNEARVHFEKGTAYDHSRIDVENGETTEFDLDKFEKREEMNSL